ncbi:MAG: membrane protein insertion efficiency factor YidD [Polyangiaceae bacterium]|jgi:putative membrane protein insertion efficiency factor|nr:membrane protein insertion efficiency factor YidD [Polyangiaceae bacterium]MBK8941243.1 membrane protein insertion efficiency factor YidD [Polyangiaceae bacterium]
MKTLLVALIRVYQLTLSKLLVLLFGPVCRFEPSCSRYALLCIEGHGVLRGSLLSVKRLCRCHPFHPGGFDPPPPAPSRSRGRRVEHDDGLARRQGSTPLELAGGEAVRGASSAHGAASTATGSAGDRHEGTHGREG